jgi:hypothetical protein
MKNRIYKATGISQLPLDKIQEMEKIIPYMTQI